MSTKMIKVDRAKINLKVASISIDSAEYQILVSIINKTLAEEKRKNTPIMNVSIRQEDAQKLFPEKIHISTKKILV